MRKVIVDTLSFVHNRKTEEQENTYIGAMYIWWIKVWNNGTEACQTPLGGKRNIMVSETTGTSSRHLVTYHLQLLAAPKVIRHPKQKS